MFTLRFLFISAIYLAIPAAAEASSHSPGIVPASADLLASSDPLEWVHHGNRRSRRSMMDRDSCGDDFVEICMILSSSDENVHFYQSCGTVGSQKQDNKDDENNWCKDEEYGNICCGTFDDCCTRSKVVIGGITLSVFVLVFALFFAFCVLPGWVAKCKDERHQSLRDERRKADDASKQQQLEKKEGHGHDHTDVSSSHIGDDEEAGRLNYDDHIKSQQEEG
eukprot:CAMPEP_0198136754 /NCGR_PEP_ID=MMETSP1443-20131203/368_1 /TAXON_ID=186043 /ORGANISM="Entomoneis sp., Strain CCMP2396" /LENGTH=221 /DNA_ID=CAMNT_0043798025 /DNA_START=172 /DNA_END=837 /DNA_ORIENTATION=-